MSDTEGSGPIVFSPDNEPYLGRELLFHFDQLISSCMERNAVVAPRTHGVRLTDPQQMACQVIPQSLSIALSIRELVRQGYLFGAHVLLRSLAERATILLYLQVFPNEIEKWNRGWGYREAPGLAKMFEAIGSKTPGLDGVRGHQLTDSMNSIVHGRPDSAKWNMVWVGPDRAGNAPSKIVNRPELCDEICANTIPWLALVQGMMNAYFPDAYENQNTQDRFGLDL